MAQTRAHIQATTRFETKAYEKITLRLRKDRPDESGLSRDLIQKAADKAGMSVNAFIIQAISDKINK